MGLDTDGVDDYVDHGDMAGVDLAVNLSWMFWLYYQTAAATKGIFGKGAQLLAYVSAASVIATGENAVWEKTATAPTVGQWVHWAFTYDGTQAAGNRIAIYKNGVAEALAGSNPGATLSDQGATTVKTGGNYTGVGYVDAIVAHLKVHNVTLTALEVLQEVYSYRPVRTAGLILWSPYDDGTRAGDYSGSRNHGTVTGALQAPGPPVSYGAYER